MIARNEESFIEDCLASVAGVCHEAIVVDTGSTDRTRELCAAAGARVLEAPWTDDFASARNVGVEVATGSHILVLDADERLAPGMAKGLLEAASTPDLLLGCLPLYNASTLDATPDEILDGSKLLNGPVFVPRLFRNLPEMRFERRVHETLTRGFNELQAKGAGMSMAIGAALIHYGDVPKHRVDHGKDDRNEKLLRMSLEDDPGDGEIAGYLLVHLIQRGRLDEARSIGEQCFPPFVARNDARPPGHLPENMVRIGYSLGLAQVECGAPDAALGTVDEALRFTPEGHPNLHYVRGLAAFAAADLEAAEESFRETLSAHNRNFAQPVLPWITNELARIKLAGVALARGYPEDALAILPPARGKWQFAIDLIRAEVDLARGEAEAAMAKLSTYVDYPKLAPDWHVLVHRALTDLGREADGLLEAAAAADRTAWLERRRAMVGSEGAMLRGVVRPAPGPVGGRRGGSSAASATTEGTTTEPSTTRR